MRSKVTLFITAAIVAIFGAVIFFGFNKSEAQPIDAKESQFVLTGTLITSTGTRFYRYEDPEYNIVCYTGGMAFSCTKK